MRGMIAGLLVMAACGGAYDVQPFGTESYASLDQPMMAGSTVYAWPVYYSDVTELLRAETVTVSPPDLAEVTLESAGRVLAIRTRELAAPGTEPAGIAGNTGTLHLTFAEGGWFDRAFTVLPGASSALVPSGVPLAAFPERKLPGERLAIFQGEELFVTLMHYSADGTHLLGHTDDAWTGDNVQLSELEPTYDGLDISLMRLVRPVGSGPAYISVGSATLPLDIVAPRSTARLALAQYYEHNAGESLAPLTTLPGHHTTLTVLAYAADGRFIYGGPPYLPVVATSSDPSIVDIDTTSPQRASRILSVVAHQTGTATIRIEFDGQVTDLPVTVL